jgi:hypothetical protein
VKELCGDVKISLRYLSNDIKKISREEADT